MNRQTKVTSLDAFEGREIVISDIHGDLDGYLALLKKVQYDPQKDRLILLGDLVEKGPKNLELIRHLMKQKEQEPHFHMIMGNCDFVSKNFLFAYRLDFIQNVLLSRKNSLIHEMIEEAGLPPLTKETDMDELAYELRKRYLKELCFINDLSHVILTPARIYTHAGVLNEQDFAHDFRYVMTTPMFGETEKTFVKPVICGHMPVTEYCRRKADFNPRFNSRANVYSIDGGNMVKEAGQLNALIFHSFFTESESVDFLPEAKAIRSTSPANRAPFFINWNHGDLQILEQGEHQSRVYSPYLNRTFWIDSSFLKQGKGTDFTNYEMPLNIGDTVKVTGVYGNKAQVKKQGILGWTLQENLDFDFDAYKKAQKEKQAQQAQSDEDAAMYEQIKAMQAHKIAAKPKEAGEK